MSPALPWVAASAAMVPALAVAVLAALRGTIPRRFAGAQLASSLAVLALVMLTFAIDQPSSIDLALALALLTLPGSLLLALFVERWL